MKLVLPYPPSDNRYYKIARNRRYLSKEGREFREKVRNLNLSESTGNVSDAVMSLMLARQVVAFGSPVAIDVLVMPPDRRKRDMLNLCKALGDSLVYAGILLDDSLIHEANFVKGDAVKGGALVIEIGEMLIPYKFRQDEIAFHGACI